MDRPHRCKRASSSFSTICAVDILDLSEELSAVFVDNHHASPAGDIEPVAGWIGHEIIPITLTSQCAYVWLM